MNDGFIVLFVGILLSFGALGFAVAGHFGGSKVRLRKRALILGNPEKRGSARRSSSAGSNNSVRRAEGNSVPLIEGIAKRFLPRQSALRNRLERTGKNITIGMYLSFCVVIAVISTLVVWLGFGISITPAVFIGFFLGLVFHTRLSALWALDAGRSFWRSFRMPLT